MKELIIKIPTGLNHSQEVKEITKAILDQKLLGQGKVNKIGDAVSVEDLETKIKVVRMPVEKPVIMKDCSVCGCSYDYKRGFKLSVNYGGFSRSLSYCSEVCRNVVSEICGENRSSKTRKGISSARFY